MCAIGISPRRSRGTIYRSHRLTPVEPPVKNGFDPCHWDYISWEFPFPYSTDTWHRVAQLTSSQSRNLPLAGNLLKLTHSTSSLSELVYSFTTKRKKERESFSLSLEFYCWQDLLIHIFLARLSKEKYIEFK